jgi:UrcA family protein
MDLRRAAVLSVAVLALAGTVPAAHAGAPAKVTTSVRIPYADLDLTTDEGMAVLYARVRRAAKAVCGAPGVTGSRLDERHDACLRAATDRAISQLGVPGLAELHREIAGAQEAAECPAPAAGHRRIVI